MLVKITENNLKGVLEKAVDVLNKGGIIAYPTETFYGLGARFDMEDSLARIYEIKGRSEEKPMPLIISSREQLALIAEPVSSLSRDLMDKFWPGPLTILLQAKKGLSRYLTSDTGKIAVRIPGKSFAYDLVQAAGFPVTSTSANLAGQPPAYNAASAEGYFKGTVDLIIDTGETAGGLPSTIVDISEIKIRVIREGAVPSSALKEFLS